MPLRNWRGEPRQATHRGLRPQVRAPKTSAGETSAVYLAEGPRAQRFLLPGAAQASMSASRIAISVSSD
jgi:hypothetical protein